MLETRKSVRSRPSPDAVSRFRAAAIIPDSCRFPFDDAQVIPDGYDPLKPEAGGVQGRIKPRGVLSALKTKVLRECEFVE